nr:alkyl sulfatase C-terminal domain-containing protein [Kitasatospora sp. SID7827]
MAGALSVDQVFDSLAIRVNGPAAWGEHLSTVWKFTDLGTTHRATLRNGVLVHAETAGDGGPADLTVTLTKPQLFALLAGKGTDGIALDGDATVLARLFAALDEPDASFAVVTP